MFAQRYSVLVLLAVSAFASPDVAPQDELSLLQTRSDLSNPRGGVPVSEVVPEPSQIEPVSFTDMSAPLPQGYSAVSETLPSLQAAPSSLQQIDATTAQEFSEGGELTQQQALIQDLKNQAQDQASQLENAQDMQGMSNNAIEHAKAQLVRQAASMQQAQEAEQSAKESAIKASKALTEQIYKGKMLEEQVKQGDEKIQQMVQERAVFAQKLEQLGKEAKQVTEHDHKDWEVALLQAQASEQKAWEAAKAESQKTLAERKIKESLLESAKAELTKMKNDVTNVQAKAAEALQKEVLEVNKKVAMVKDEANAELKKASGQLQKEHAQVQSVVAWAKTVQTASDAKLAWAKKAQDDTATQVNWAAVAKREAARAEAAMEKIQELKGPAKATANGNYGFN